MTQLPYLAGYSSAIQAQALELLESGELGPHLAKRYPKKHQVRTNPTLWKYVGELKAECMRTAPPLRSVVFDDRLRLVHRALGLQTTSVRVQGSQLRKRREIRIASLFKDRAPEFLRMIVVHELAHLKHADHDRDFYRLCAHMEPDYQQFELDLRLALTLADWQASELPLGE